MEVCLLINSVPPDGAPTLVLELVRHTDDPDISYTVCVIEGDRELVPAFESAGATVVDVRAEFKFDPRAIARMWRFFEQHDFDLIHAHLPYAMTLGRTIGSVAGCRPIVTTQHNVPSNYHPVTRTLEHLTRLLDSRTIAVSNGVERAFTGESVDYRPGQERQWCTIHNGIDVETFNAAVRDASTERLLEQWDLSGSPVFLNVARYVPAKSQRDLLAAMERVVRNLPEAHLLIVGWGPLESDLRAEVDRRELGDSVTITGKVPTVHEYYALADVFVSASTFEGLPIAHLEAMAAELPLVATDIPGVEEVIEQGRTGLLVPPGRPDLLAEAMEEFRPENRRHAVGKASLERVRERFDIERTVENHCALYRELVG